MSLATLRRHPSARRYLRLGFWVWTFVASVGATVGAVVGTIELHRDEWPR